jgi:phospholipase/carboxylesterase
MMPLPAIEIETKPSPDAAVIWLHGLGADGNDFAPIVPELQLPENMGVRFIFPHAPSIPVTINGGFVMPAWYDILQMEIDRQVDTAQLLMSADAIARFIDNERNRGIDGRRILIAGFSQGGAVAYQTALSYSSPLGGLLAMSTYLATGAILDFHDENRNIAIEVHHGLHDPVVPVHLGKKAAEQLKLKGYTVRYREYPMEHSVCAQQIADISSWLQERLEESSRFARPSARP